VVEQIEGLAGNINLEALSHGEVLDQREVDIIDRTAGFGVSACVSKCAKTSLDIARVRVFGEIGDDVRVSVR